MLATKWLNLALFTSLGAWTVAGCSSSGPGGTSTDSNQITPEVSGGQRTPVASGGASSASSTYPNDLTPYKTISVGGVEELFQELPDGYTVSRSAVESILSAFSAEAIVRSGTVEPGGFVDGQNVPEQRLLCKAGELYLPQDTPAPLEVAWSGEPIELDLLALDGEPSPSRLEIRFPVNVAVEIAGVYAAREAAELVVNQTNDHVGFAISFRVYNATTESPGLIVDCGVDGAVQDALCHEDVAYEEPQVTIEGRLTDTSEESWMRLRIVREPMDDTGAPPDWLLEMPTLVESMAAPASCETESGIIVSNVQAGARE